LTQTPTLADEDQTNANANANANAGQQTMRAAEVDNEVASNNTINNTIASANANANTGPTPDANQHWTIMPTPDANTNVGRRRQPLSLQMREAFFFLLLADSPSSHIL
jgi:hypothetical protein